jgi:hypothetical protein
MWREPCIKKQRENRINGINLCSSEIWFDKSYHIKSGQMRFAEQIRNSRGGTTSLIPVVKPTIVPPTNNF